MRLAEDEMDSRRGTLMYKSFANDHARLDRSCDVHSEICGIAEAARESKRGSDSKASLDIDQAVFARTFEKN
jgi:hypothetical protein